MSEELKPTDEQCDRIVALTMDKLASKRRDQYGDMHALDLNPNIMEHHSLRRSIVRAAYMLGEIGSRAAPDAPQPEPAAPTPDTFMGEPVLTRWKPLNRDDSRLALHQSMHNRSFGNPSDDKLMLEWLWENGYALCKRVPDEAAPTPQQQALDRMVENAETLGLYEAAPTEATLDQMAGKAWDRFQRHTAELQALENCRLYAARHRKEDWAATILRFCADGGATGSPLREAAPTVVEPDWDDIREQAEEATGLKVERHTYSIVIREVRKRLAATPPRAPTVVEPLHVDESKRYRVVQKGYWWRVQIGDGQQTVGRCFSQTEAQQLAHALLVAYRDGAFVASRATPPRAALTDEQLKQILMDHPGPITQGWFYNFARAVIAADRGEK